MQRAPGWTAISGSSGLSVRVDDYSIQLSSTSSATFFVRVQIADSPGQILFSDFTLSPSEVQAGSNAIVLLGREYSIDLKEKLLRIRAPSLGPVHADYDFTIDDWSKTALCSITDGLQHLGVALIDYGLVTDFDGRTELIMRTRER